MAADVNVNALIVRSEFSGRERSVRSRLRAEDFEEHYPVRAHVRGECLLQRTDILLAPQILRSDTLSRSSAAPA